jgi:hypothetical protein
MQKDNTAAPATESTTEELVDIVTPKESIDPMAPEAPATIQKISMSEELTTFTSEKYNFSFEYPVELGEFSLVASNEQADTGFRLIGTFSNAEYLNVGGVSNDYSAPMGGTPFSTQGYEASQGESPYVFKFISDLTIPLWPAKVIDAPIGDILLVDKCSRDKQVNVVGYVKDDNDDLVPCQGLGWINEENKFGALINLDNDEFSGVMILNNNPEVFPNEEFEKMLETFDSVK